MYVCVYLYMYMYIHAHIYTHTYMHTCVYIKKERIWDKKGLVLAMTILSSE